MSDVSIDAKGKKCPLPIVILSQEIRKIDAGKAVEIVADDLAFEEDVKAFCRVSGNELVSLQKKEGRFVAVVKKS